ncbi:hypothetical protein OESDEN_08982 [Oesophagostomum dentatum]|uniref:Uncharacterized protein n=1 Tax=Oesophagostomum dentatum TaxID=61180 RepID=A0A0B1T732_OESDE|nr:hypothetical protein OESDEN_08982 [Oesophagostomum dentatum]
MPKPKSYSPACCVPPIALTMADFDDADDGPKSPTVTIAFEYIEAEQTFNFYIRRVSHAPYVPSINPKYSRGVMHVVKGLPRKTWIGTRKSITSEKVNEEAEERAY